MILLRHLRPVARAAAITLSIFGVATVTLAFAESTPLSQQELDWARDALQRNGALEVVSVDLTTGWITVRVKATGELRKVFAGSVVATLPLTAQSTTAPSTTQPSATPASAPSGSSATSGSEAAPVPAAPKGERVLLSGPGYSIAAAPGPGAAGAGQAQAAAATGGAALAVGLPVEHLHDPIVCQGSRLMHIDSRNLQFDGDALSVQDGCELHITNSRIMANGVGIAARAASVHIDNSSIEGVVGSIEASDGAQVYASSSSFKGLIRHLDTAEFHDLGGNVGN